MLSYTSPSTLPSTNTQTTPVLDASSSSSPMNYQATPRDDQRVNGMRGKGVKGKKVESTRRSVRVRGSSAGLSSPFVVDCAATEDIPSIEFSAGELSLSSSAAPSSATSTTRLSRGRVATPVLPRVASTSTLALAQAHGITPDQFEKAKQQVMRFLRADASSGSGVEEKGKGRATLSRSASYTSADNSSADLLLPLSLSSRNVSPAIVNPTSSPPLVAAARLDSTPLSTNDNNDRNVKPRPSLEEMAERSGRKRDPRTGRNEQDLREWAEEASGEQDYSSDELEEEQRQSAYATRMPSNDQNQNHLATFANHQHRPTPPSLPSSSSFPAFPASATSPDTPFRSSPAVRYQARTQQPSPLHQPTPKSVSRGMMERFIDERPTGEVEQRHERIVYPPISPGPNKGIRPSVLFSPDVARLLRNELEELGNSAMRQNKSAEIVSDIVDELDSSPARPVQPYDQDYTPGFSTVAKRLRDPSAEGSDSLKRSRWGAGDRSPCPSTTSLIIQAPSFGDSSPAMSDRALSLSSTGGFGSMYPSAVHPTATAPDFLYHAPSSTSSSSPVSSVNSHSDYAPTPYRLSPVPRASTSSAIYHVNHNNSHSNSNGMMRPYQAMPAPPAPPAPAPAPKKRPQALKRSDSSMSDSHSKPSWSYAALIGQAIYSTEESKISLADVYVYIMASYPYYKKEDSGWQNSIRHNLSLNDCFIKTARGVNNPGKGCLWAIAPGSEEQFTDGGFMKRSVAAVRKSKNAAAKTKEGTRASSRRQNRDDSPGSPRDASPALSGTSSASRSNLLPAFQSVTRSPSLPAQSYSTSAAKVGLKKGKKSSRTDRAASVPSSSPNGIDVEADLLVGNGGDTIMRGLAPAYEHRPQVSPATVVAALSRPSSRRASAAAASVLFSATSSTSSSNLLRRPTMASIPASPPTSVYSHLAAPYHSAASSASLQNHRALALLASPEPAGIMSPAPSFAPPPTQVPSHDLFTQRAAFLPAFNVFPSSARSRQRTSEGLSDFAMSSPTSYTRSPISSLRNSGRGDGAGGADPEKRVVISMGSPRSGRGFGVRHHLPLVAALAEAASKTPPRMTTGMGTSAGGGGGSASSHGRTRSIHQFGTPAGGSAASPGWGIHWGGIGVGVGGGAESYHPTSESIGAELEETFGGGKDRSTRVGGGNLWASPSNPAPSSYAAW